MKKFANDLFKNNLQVILQNLSALLYIRIHADIYALPSNSLNTKVIFMMASHSCSSEISRCIVKRIVFELNHIAFTITPSSFGVLQSP